MKLYSKLSKIEFGVSKRSFNGMANHFDGFLTNFPAPFTWCKNNVILSDNIFGDLFL